MVNTTAPPFTTYDIVKLANTEMAMITIGVRPVSDEIQRTSEMELEEEVVYVQRNMHKLVCKWLQ